MRIVIITLAVMAVALPSAGCLHNAAFRVTPEHFEVEGRSNNPEAITRAAADAYATARTTDEYWAAVREGRAYPYAGGYGGDYWYYYQGITPPRTAVPAAETATAVPAGGDYATREELGEVRELADDAHGRATDSIRMHRRLRDRLSGSASP